jgi:hypothetical protein
MSKTTFRRAWDRWKEEKLPGVSEGQDQEDYDRRKASWLAFVRELEERGEVLPGTDTLWELPPEAVPPWAPREEPEEERRYG